MGAPTLHSWQDLFVHELKDTYDAEHQLLEALPKMREAANDPELSAAFSDHHQQTKQHVERLEQVFSQLGLEAEREACPAMRGLITEGQQLLESGGDPTIRDSGLITAAQRVEHYEIALYGSLRTLANFMGQPDLARQLDTTLEEEKSADNRLTGIAKERINPPEHRQAA
jgi:ferritin-like metal-binding protein YciE